MKLPLQYRETQVEIEILEADGRTILYVSTKGAKSDWLEGIRTRAKDIIRAVNAHDALADVARQVLDFQYVGKLSIMQKVRADARAALELMEERND